MDHAPVQIGRHHIIVGFGESSKQKAPSPPDRTPFARHPGWAHPCSSWPSLQQYPQRNISCRPPLVDASGLRLGDPSRASWILRPHADCDQRAVSRTWRLAGHRILRKEGHRIVFDAAIRAHQDLVHVAPNGARSRVAILPDKPRWRRVAERPGRPLRPLASGRAAGPRWTCIAHRPERPGRPDIAP
jgi:hypothetical protein